MVISSTFNKRDLILSNITTTNQALIVINNLTQSQLKQNNYSTDEEILECIEDVAKYTLATRRVG